MPALRRIRAPRLVRAITLLAASGAVLYAKESPRPPWTLKAMVVDGKMCVFPHEVSYTSGIVMAQIGVELHREEFQRYLPHIPMAKDYPLAWDAADQVWYFVGAFPQSPGPAHYWLMRIPFSDMAKFAKGPKPERATTTKPLLEGLMDLDRKVAPFRYDRAIEFLGHKENDARSLHERRIWFDVRAVTREVVELYVLTYKRPATGDKSASLLEIWRFDGRAWSRDHSMSSPFGMPFAIVECADSIFLHSEDGTLWHLEGLDSGGGGHKAAATRGASEEAQEQDKEGGKGKPALSLRKVGTLPGAKILIIDKDAKRALAVSETAIFTIGKKVTQRPWKAPEEPPDSDSKLSPWAKHALAAWRSAREETGE